MIALPKTQTEELIDLLEKVHVQRKPSILDLYYWDNRPDGVFVFCYG